MKCVSFVWLQNIVFMKSCIVLTKVWCYFSVGLC